MELTKMSWRKSVSLLGMGVWAGSLALVAPAAQAQSSNGAYCFSVRTTTSIYASPTYDSITPDSYVAGDTAYATTSPPTTVWFNDGTADGNSFVEVAYYGGNVGWIPRFPAGSDVPILVDITDCPNPGLNAAGYTPPIGEGPVPGPGAACFFVQRSTNLYSQPSFAAMTGDRYAAGDTAFATTNPPTSVWFNDATADGNSFVAVTIYDGSTAWVPRFPAGSDAPILVDLASCQ